MPKLYFRSKDVKNVEVIQWAGTCYTRTGEYTSVSNESNVPVEELEVFYAGCDSCAGGQVYLSAGSVGHLVQHDQFQIKSSLTAGQSATIQLPVSAAASSSYHVVLSAITDTTLSLDVSSVAGGPFIFSNVGDTYELRGAGADAVLYQVTLAAFGSHYLTFKTLTPPSPTPTLTPTPTPTPTLSGS